MRRQIRRHSTRRSSSSSSSSSSRRHLSHLWTRLFHTRGPRTRGHALLLDPPGPAQVAFGLQSYRTVSEQEPQASHRSGAGLGDEAGALTTTPGSCCLANMELRPYVRESPASPVSFQSEDGTEGAGLLPLSRESIRLQQWETLTPDQSGPSLQEPSVGPCPPWGSKKLILEFAVNLQGVSLRRYSPLGPLSPRSPSSQQSTSQPLSQGLEMPLSPEPASSSSTTSTSSSASSSVKAKDPHTSGVPSRRRRGKRRLSTLSRTFSDEGGGSASTPC